MFALKPAGRRSGPPSVEPVAGGPDHHPLGHLLSAWPLPALASWATCWMLFGAMILLGASRLETAAASTGLGLALSALGTTRIRRLIVALGFPVSLAASGLVGAVPAWGWLLPLAALAMLYPLGAWRDAPWFPTPAMALRGLAHAAPLAPGARVLDAGCGLGQGLQELRREYPAADLRGLERSRPLRRLCAWRCRRFAKIEGGDMWAADWSGIDLVYVFQRPESMTRVMEKACREMRPGTWLVSLEFPVPAAVPSRVLEEEGRRRVWLYRLGDVSRRRRGAGR